MAIQSLELRQNPDDPNVRYLQITRTYDPNQGALGYPEQYQLTPEQFGQFQSAGLRPIITRDPLLYQKGQFDPTRFAQYARGSEGDINRIAASYAQLTPSGVDLATNPQAREDFLARAMGGALNPLTPGSPAQKQVEALKSAQGTVKAAIISPAQERKVVQHPSAPQGWGVDSSGHFAKIGTPFGASPASTTPPSGVSGGAPSEAKKAQGDVGQQLAKQSPEQVAQSTRDFLKSIGVSDDLINSVSPRDLNVLAMMNQVMQKKAENDEKLAPKNLTLEEINKYLEDAEVDAKKELDPYYKEQFDFAKQDLLQNIAFQTGQLQDLEAMQAKQFQQQEQLGGQMAEAGTAQSGIRLEAERRLREQQQGIVKSQRRQLGQNIYGLGSELERTFGSQKAASLYPTLTSQPQAGLPEQQLGYTPLGGRIGSLGKEQEVATRQERDRLALLEMQKRQLLQGQ